MTTKYYYNRISVPEHVNNEIQRYKRACAKYIGKFPSEKSPGHISFICVPLTSLVNSDNHINVDRYYEYVEYNLIKVSPITLHITGFSYLTHGKTKRTICAELNLDPATLNWFNIIMNILVPGSIIKKPHLSIARAISTEQFNILWPYFQKLNYKDSFKVDWIEVLQQDANTGYHPMLPFKKIFLRNATFDEG